MSSDEGDRRTFANHYLRSMILRHGSVILDDFPGWSRLLCHSTSSRVLFLLRKFVGIYETAAHMRFHRKKRRIPLFRHIGRG
jgi:hypothetical protein